MMTEHKTEKTRSEEQGQEQALDEDWFAQGERRSGPPSSRPPSSQRGPSSARIPSAAPSAPPLGDSVADTWFK